MCFMLKLTLSLNLYYKWRILWSKSKMRQQKLMKQSFPRLVNSLIIAALFSQYFFSVNNSLLHPPFSVQEILIKVLMYKHANCSNRQKTQLNKRWQQSRIIFTSCKLNSVTARKLVGFNGPLLRLSLSGSRRTVSCLWLTQLCHQSPQNKRQR